MSRTSEYSLDLVVQGDDVRNTIRSLEKELKGLGEKAKKATDASGITDSLKNAQTAIGGMKSQMADMAKAMGGDFDSILKAYERNSAKAISQFEAQYAKLEAERQSKEGEYKRLQGELKSAQSSADLLARTPRKNLTYSYSLIAQIQERIKELGYDQLKSQIEQNRQVRANLADIRRQSILEQEEVKQLNAAKVAETERTKERRKLQELEEAYTRAKEKRTNQKYDSGTELKKLKAQLSKAKKANDAAENERLEQAIKDAKAQRDLQSETNNREIESLKEKIRLQRASVELEEAQNRLANEQANAKRKEKYDKLEELKAKRKAARGLAEKAMLKQEIALQKAFIKQVEAAEKAQKRNGDAIQSAISKTEKMAKAWEKTKKVIGTVANVTHKLAKAGSGAMQFAYNATGMIGGAARTAKAAFGMVSGAVSGVASVANREVEKERLANRVKGFSLDDARDMMGQLYIQTGADYGVIVDAINRVQNVLKSNDKGELITATATEIRYPGAAQTFASSNTQIDATSFARYGNRLKAIQNATGASDEQIQASTEILNNLKPGAFNNATVTDLQTVYLGLQNSGAFDSQEELEKAFKKFVSEQSKSGKNAFEFAQNYDWNKTISGDSNRLQASNTLGKLDWSAIGGALNRPDEQQSQKQTASETMAMKMRQLEEKKNELMLKLVPAIQPIVERIADLLTGPTGSQIIDGLVNLFKAVIPALEPIFKLLEPVLKVVSRVMNWLGDVVIPKLLSVFQSIADFFGSDDGDEYAMPQNAAGGLAFMPSVVGERGPEAIIPLDYSRAQRAENIANTVNQTFNMGNNQTTALSLAQAVRSRDFTRAMTDNQFFTRRCGAF